MKIQRFPRRVLVMLLPALAGAFLGVEILAGTSGPEDEKDVRSSSLLHRRSPRFIVALQLEQPGISAFFTEVSGLGSENEILELRDGTDPTVIRKLPGRLKYDNLVLKRGVTADSSLWQWRRLVETGGIAEARTNGRLTLLDRGSPVATWSFVRAWPAKITGPRLHGEGNDLAIEAIVIAHEGFLRE